MYLNCDYVRVTITNDGRDDEDMRKRDKAKAVTSTSSPVE